MAEGFSEVNEGFCGDIFDIFVYLFCLIGGALYFIGYLFYKIILVPVAVVIGVILTVYFLVGPPLFASLTLYNPIISVNQPVAFFEFTNFTTEPSGFQDCTIDYYVSHLVITYNDSNNIPTLTSCDYTDETVVDQPNFLNMSVTQCQIGSGVYSFYLVSYDAKQKGYVLQTLLITIAVLGTAQILLMVHQLCTDRVPTSCLLFFWLATLSLEVTVIIYSQLQFKQSLDMTYRKFDIKLFFQSVDVDVFTKGFIYEIFLAAHEIIPLLCIFTLFWSYDNRFKRKLIVIREKHEYSEIILISTTSDIRRDNQNLEDQRRADMSKENICRIIFVIIALGSLIGVISKHLELWVPSGYKIHR
ncbi:hypothetical protein PPL_02196 [Heterostelium album PN500]|uniref:Uncharacterized protein n=1 Tax=Heterostelium pallidum (strain ATCC 26659 / Pp 5 / PN500) TaxID=670386 RepID=D3B1M2_HETP5|nr:hypothetical protein PPL_02196 [Heterostelium album PN500]EFA85196.1 hypothetical protein PPL_02196 [Heterostelium album PN500]|eukprot:XP_020437305.1 hypothetical protein PPL_02196 [Heterostelium album PN500]